MVLITLPWLLDDPSVDIVQKCVGFGSLGDISTRKFVDFGALNAFLASYVTLNSDISTYHLVNLPTKSGLWRINFIGKYILTNMV